MACDPQAHQIATSSIALGAAAILREDCSAAVQEGCCIVGEGEVLFHHPTRHDS
jgi:hypothetical protein